MTPSSRDAPSSGETEGRDVGRVDGPALIAVGGFAGTGKSLITRRLCAALCIPRLGSDTLGRTIRNSAGITHGDVNAYWIAYDVLFSLCEEFIQCGVSVILDLTLGWEFQWRHLDSIVDRHPRTTFLPVILRCPIDVCIARIRQRHKTDPEYYDPPEVYRTEPKNIDIWEYLAQLKRPEAHFVDADKAEDDVFAEVLDHVSTRLRA